MKAAIRAWWVVALNGWCYAGAFGQASPGYSFTVLDSVEPDVAWSRGVMARGISGNGSVVAGSSAAWIMNNQVVTEFAYAWIRQPDGSWQRKELPLLGRPDVPPEEATPMGRPLSLSEDGNIIGGMVGPRVAALTWNPGVAGVWTNVLGDVVQVQHAVPSEAFTDRSFVSGISSDGVKRLIVSANVQSGARRLFMIDGGETTEIDGPDPFEPYSHLLFGGGSMSADGIVVALTDADSSSTRAYRWQLTHGMSQLPIDQRFPDYLRHSVAWVVSSDGRTVGGWHGQYLDHTQREETSELLRRYPTVWIDGVRHVLPSRIFAPWPLGVFQYGRVTAISSDGRVIAGVLNSAYPVVFSDIMSPYANKPAIWVAERMIVLEHLLAAEGVDFQGVLPRWISGISNDGSVITGWGTRLPEGATQEQYVSWVATFLAPGMCDDIDFNRDGSRFDPMDIDAFLSVYSEGPCLPAGAQCRDIDFNNDGSLFDPRDIEAFLSVFSEGPCL